MCVANIFFLIEKIQLQPRHIWQINLYVISTEIHAANYIGLNTSVKFCVWLFIYTNTWTNVIVHEELGWSTYNVRKNYLFIFKDLLIEITISIIRLNK